MCCGLINIIVLSVSHLITNPLNKLLLNRFIFTFSTNQKSAMLSMPHIKGVVSITVIIPIVSCCLSTYNGICFLWYPLPPKEFGFIHNPLTHNQLWDLVRLTKLIYFRSEWIKVQSLLRQITVRLWLNNHLIINYFYEFAYNSS